MATALKLNSQAWPGNKVSLPNSNLVSLVPLNAGFVAQLVLPLGVVAEFTAVVAAKLAPGKAAAKSSVACTKVAGTAPSFLTITTNGTVSTRVALTTALPVTALVTAICCGARVTLVAGGAALSPLAVVGSVCAAPVVLDAITPALPPVAVL